MELLCKLRCVLITFCCAGGMLACGTSDDKENAPEAPEPGIPGLEIPGPKHGTGWVEQKYTYNIQKPWNLKLEDRYTYDEKTDEHTFEIMKGDEPFKQGDHTAPRCELRMQNDYTEGNHQFEADYYAVEGTHRTCVMQVFGYPVAINIKVYGENGGTLKWHDTHDIVTSIYNKWVHLNVVHIFDERQIHVYVDGKLIRSFKVKEDAPLYYFKCGVYSTASETSKVKIKNIKYYSKP